MQELADKIAKIFTGYNAHRGMAFTSKHVLKWVNQFDEEHRQFILEEFLHIASKGIYVNENQARYQLIDIVEFLAREYKFDNVLTFLLNVQFLNIQPPGKSQSDLLKLLEQELPNKFGIELSACGTVSKKYAVYLDDILATGGTIYNDCLKWLKIQNADGQTNFDKIVSGEKKLSVAVFCKHSWPNIDWRLKLAFDKTAILDKIKYVWCYEIENHPTKRGQQLNFAYPNINQPEKVINYLEGLNAKYKGEFAFRKDGFPIQENFFSSPGNRIRFENVLLMKGIELLDMVIHLNDNHRPMGATSPSTKTLGTGTLFFTWRNISNTTPIVFWWKVNWYPLFELFNRGN